MPTRLKATAFVAAAFAIAISPRCLADNGIYVGTPKSFDDSFLKAQLKVIQDQFNAIKAVDPTSFATRIGAVSGATLQQSALMLSATGQPTPGVVTNTSPSGTVQETTQAALTPAAPTVPPSTLTLPSAPSISALDALNEALQLNYEIANISLLLNGSLSDRFLSPNVAKQRVTLGIPVTIDAPRFGHANDVAEVQVTVCTEPDAHANAAAPSVIAVLPRENTYNVATLTDTSVGLGVGAIAGIFSVNVGYLGAKKTYYLVRQQDTVALQKNPLDGPACGNPENSTTVAWQFYPAAGTKYIRSGMRQMFLQLALPKAKRDENGLLNDVSVNVGVRTLWRRHVWGTPAVSGKAEDIEEPSTPTPVLAPDTTPHASKFTVTDVGSGNLLVRASGTFLQGLRARVGSSFMDSKSPGFFAGEEVLQFMASGQAIATSGTALVAIDGAEGELIFYNLDLNDPVDELVGTRFGELFDRGKIDRTGVVFDADGDPPYLPDPPGVLDCRDYPPPPTAPASETKSAPDGEGKAAPEGQPPVKTVDGKPSVTAASLANSKAIVDALSTLQVWKAQRATNLIRPLGGGTPRAEAQGRNPFYTNKRLKIASVSRSRYSQNSWRVVVRLIELASAKEYLYEMCNGLPLVMTVNGKMYGLSDAPFFLREAFPLRLVEQPAKKSDFYQIWYRLTAIVPDDVMSGQSIIKAQRLFMGRNFESEVAYFTPPQLTAQKVATLAQGKTDVWAITGSGLGDGLELVYPPASSKIRLNRDNKNSALALLSIDKGAAEGLKQVVLLNNFNAVPKQPEIVIVALPEDEKTSKPEPPAMSLKAAPVTVGEKRLIVTGTGLDKVALVRYLRTPVNIVLTTQDQKSQLLVDLPPAATATPGTRYLDVTDADGKPSRLKVVVQAKKDSAT